MRFAAAGEAYALQEHLLQALGEEAVLVHASVLRAEDAADAPIAARVLVTGRDRLIWRARIVRSREDAEVMLHVHAPALGL
jgi:hypothetical protein